MPRKRRASTASLQDADDEEFATAELKYNKDHQDVQEGCKAPRNAANARERARMRVLSKAFCRLKTTLPWVPADTKLSKLDTLRLAATYIAHLRAVLQDDGDIANPETTRSLSLALSWPFALQGGGAPMVINNSCNTSPSSTSSSSSLQQRSTHELQCSLHHAGHQNIPIRHNHESQLPYY